LFLFNQCDTPVYLPQKAIDTCFSSLNIAITTTHNLSQLEALNSGLLLTHSLLEAVFLAQEFITLFGELTALARYSLVIRNESLDLATQ
jgi:ABC-type taurine transport system ATPase subunit